MTDTPDANTLYGDKRSNGQLSTSYVQSSEHVDVFRAEQEFNALSRQLTVQSQNPQPNSKTSSATAIQDAEKGEDGTTPFNLRDYLSSSNDANEQAGIKHKVSAVATSLNSWLITRESNSTLELPGRTYRLM